MCWHLNSKAPIWTRGCSKPARRKKLMFGCVFNSDAVMETPQHVASRLLKAAEYLPADQILAAPNCGLAPMSFDTAAEKLDIMVKGAQMVRKKIGS